MKSVNRDRWILSVYLSIATISLPTYLPIMYEYPTNHAKKAKEQPTKMPIASNEQINQPLEPKRKRDKAAFNELNNKDHNDNNNNNTYINWKAK